MEKAIGMLQRLRTLGKVMLQYAYSKRHLLKKGWVFASLPLV
jgi:hypothetical protein